MRWGRIALLGSVLLSGCIGGSEQPRRPQRPVTTRAPAIRPTPPPYDARVCLATLRQNGASFVSLTDRLPAPDCPLRNTVALFSTPSDTGALGVTNLGIVGCPVATRFVAWARYGAGRAAAQILGSPIARIETFGSYSCRTVAGSPRLSAHAVAAAIDVSAFVLADGRRLTVKGNWNDPNPAVRQFFRVIHASACKRFGTVLGPDYNAAHKDHLHMEVGDGSFCR